MSLERGVDAFAGFMVLLSVALTYFVHPAFIWLTVFFGANLFQQAFTGFCPASIVMRKLGMKKGTRACHAALKESLMKSALLWFTTLTALQLAACAGTPAGDDGVGRGRATDCIFGRTITDWTPLDNENLILFAGRRRPYHVQLTRAAFGLARDFVIGVYDRDGRVCPFGGDAIIVRGGGIDERITISSIRRLTEEQLQQVYVDFGIEEPVIVETTPIELEETDTED